MKFLISKDNPGGVTLENMLVALRHEMIERCTHISRDMRPEASHVMSNNIKIMGLLSEALDLAEDSTRALDRSFGPHHAGERRIGD